MQRGYRHTSKPYTAPQRLRAPAQGYKAVRARKLLREMERLEGIRFSPVTVKPKAPSKYSSHYLRSLGISIPSSNATLKTLDSFKRGVETKLSTFSSRMGWAPVKWPGSMVFIDLANCGGLLKVRNLYRSSTWIRNVLDDLVEFSQTRGCQVHVMVEGRQRNLSAPRGIHMIRAQPIRKRDIGDDAIVEYVHTTVEDGIEPSKIVLITDDKGLVRRMPFGVERRSPKWLALEILTSLAETQLGDVPIPAPSVELKVSNDKVKGSSDKSDVNKSGLDSGRAWRDWWGLLTSIPQPFWSSVKQNDIHIREESTQARTFERG